MYRSYFCILIDKMNMTAFDKHKKKRSTVFIFCIDISQSNEKVHLNVNIQEYILVYSWCTLLYFSLFQEIAAVYSGILFCKVISIMFFMGASLFVFDLVVLTFSKLSEMQITSINFNFSNNQTCFNWFLLHYLHFILLGDTKHEQKYLCCTYLCIF